MFDISANPIQKPRCSTCPHRFTYLESISRREGGVNLQFGREYCKGGKKYRAFKNSDPKTYPPDWCPKRKDPCEFRIYTFKDTDAWYLHYMVNKDAVPSGYQCAVRLSGTVEVSPASFYSMLENKTASELLGVEVKSGEIVEIDDGLKPCCFYVKFGDSKYLPHWDIARARENQYRGGDDA